MKIKINKWQKKKKKHLAALRQQTCVTQTAHRKLDILTKG